MNKYIKKAIQWVPLTALMVVAFNNCAQPTTEDFDLASSSAYDSASEVDSEKLGIPFALLSAEQTLQSMLSVTNITAPPAALLTEYNSRYGSLAAGNDLSMANSPLMLSSTSLAGEVCNTMITNEKAMMAANRAFFGSVDFNVGVDNMSSAALNSSIRGMARSFWGRNETREEYELLAAYKTEFSGALAANARTQAASSSNFLNALCAAMLSSLEAITY